MRIKLTRDVTMDQCPWLDQDFKQGDVVYEFTGNTYGCIGGGIACSMGGEFFELPYDACEFIEEDN